MIGCEKKCTLSTYWALLFFVYFCVCFDILFLVVVPTPTVRPTPIPTRGGELRLLFVVKCVGVFLP